MTSCPAFIVGFLTIAIVPYIHIGILYSKVWVPDKQPVDKQTCRCSCFDTIFKGEYENPGNVGYKHIYFNATRHTFSIWVVTVLFILLMFESIKVIVLLIQERSLRMSMLILYLINIYPLYYCWWVYFSYQNEEFHKFFYHQALFTVTEIFVTICVVRLCDRRVEKINRHCLVIIGISVVHVLSAGIDQFIIHVLFWDGKGFQIIRDIFLMIPDISHVIIPVWLLYKQRQKSHIAISNMEVFLCVLFILLSTLVFKLSFTG